MPTIKGNPVTFYSYVQLLHDYASALTSQYKSKIMIDFIDKADQGLVTTEQMQDALKSAGIYTDVKPNGMVEAYEVNVLKSYNNSTIGYTATSDSKINPTPQGSAGIAGSNKPSTINPSSFGEGSTVKTNQILSFDKSKVTDGKASFSESFSTNARHYKAGVLEAEPPANRVTTSVKASPSVGLVSSIANVGTAVLQGYEIANYISGGAIENKLRDMIPDEWEKFIFGDGTQNILIDYETQVSADTYTFGDLVQKIQIYLDERGLTYACLFADQENMLYKADTIPSSEIENNAYKGDVRHIDIHPVSTKKVTINYAYGSNVAKVSLTCLSSFIFWCISLKDKNATSTAKQIVLWGIVSDRALNINYESNINNVEKKDTLILKAMSMLSTSFYGIYSYFTIDNENSNAFTNDATITYINDDKAIDISNPNNAFGKANIAGEDVNCGDFYNYIAFSTKNRYMSPFDKADGYVPYNVILSRDPHDYYIEEFVNIPYRISDELEVTGMFRSTDTGNGAYSVYEPGLMKIKLSSECKTGVFAFIRSESDDEAMIAVNPFAVSTEPIGFNGRIAFTKPSHPVPDVIIDSSDSTTYNARQYKIQYDNDYDESGSVIYKYIYLTLFYSSGVPYRYSKKGNDTFSLDTLDTPITYFKGTKSTNDYAVDSTVLGKIGDSYTPYPTTNYLTGKSSDAYKTLWYIAYLIMFAGVDLHKPHLKSNGKAYPDFDKDDTLENNIKKLRERYPWLFDNRIEQDVIEDDGTINTINYLKVPLPTGGERDNPTSKGIEQGDTETLIKNPSSPNYEPDEEEEEKEKTQIKTIINWINNPNPKPEPEPEPEPDTSGSGMRPDYTPPTSNPEPNPPDEGDGDTPLPIIPIGTASALWSIYNPTLEQVKSLGGWLWSSNFADQILKVLADPMQAIISLHKVFGTPSISGTGEIKVGYLSSGISGVNIVNNQYTHIDCGSVNLYEYFGNVFDYPPYTDIQIYLPFIGIVPLRVEDVLRSTITVTYDIDVLTGACLANINVLRDNTGGVLYTYNGNCAVEYPLSSGSYLGVVSTLLGIAGGFGVGGVVGGIVGGAMSIMNGKGTNIERSGNLSGNAGAMGIKKPYVIISRPITAMANDYQKYMGIPTNSLARIGDCKGFISCKEVFIKGGRFENDKRQNITAEQANEIETLLKNGVIIN